MNPLLVYVAVRWPGFRRSIRGSQPFLLFGLRCRCLYGVCARVCVVLMVLGFAALSVVRIGRRALLVQFDVGLIFLGFVVLLCATDGRVCSYPTGLFCVCCVDPCMLGTLKDVAESHRIGVGGGQIV